MTASRVKTNTLLALLTVTVFTNTGANAGEQFGETIARTLQDGDAHGFTALVDKDSVIDRALTGVKGSDGFVTGLRNGLERGLSEVGSMLVDSIGPEARLSYRRTRNVEGVQRVLVRLDMGDKGLNYIDFFVRERPDGSWAIFDWIDYVQGQTYTESLRMALAFSVKENPSLLNRLLGVPDVDRKVAGQIAEIGKAGRQGDWDRWLEIYGTLPAKIQNSRVLLVTRIVAANMIGDIDEYMNAMANLHTHHGEDPTLSLALVDYYVLSGDYSRAYEAVDRLDDYTGGDAALTNLRSGIALHEGDNAASVFHAREAISQDADYERPYWNIMVAGSRAGDYKAAMEGVRGLEKRFGHEFSEEALVNEEDFNGLVASKEWRSRQ